jgi:hypothetical protein
MRPWNQLPSGEWDFDTPPIHSWRDAEGTWFRWKAITPAGDNPSRGGRPSSSNSPTRVATGLRIFERQENATASSSEESIVVDTAFPTFIPPPKKDITPELIEQSLPTQHQNTATVASVIARLVDGVIMYLVQLDGIVANLIPMNASTTFPCGAIGSNSQPDMIVVPKYVRQGAPQVTVADCRCIAINMYDPNVITYWVQDHLGRVFSLVGSNKVLDIDKLDTGQPIALSMLPTPPKFAKRAEILGSDLIELPRRQVVRAVPCTRRCPEGMEPIAGNLLLNPPECGCLAKTDKVSKLMARGLSEPGPYSAIMSKEACEAMKCINNHDRPPMFNPFSKTCWCTDPIYTEKNSAAWAPGSTNV